MKTLLVVDDKTIEREGVAFLVAEYALPLKVLQASSGKEAMSILSENTVDILFTDIRMPQGDGLWLAQQARAKNPDLLVIIFSAYSDFEYARSAINYGVFRYMLKPIDIKEFLDVMQDAVSTLAAREQMVSNMKVPATKVENQSEGVAQLQVLDQAMQGLWSRMLLISFSRANELKTVENIHDLIAQHLQGVRTCARLDNERLLVLLDRDDEENEILKECATLKAALEQLSGAEVNIAFSETLPKTVERAKGLIEARDYDGLERVIDSLFEGFRAQEQFSLVYARYICAELVTELLRPWDSDAENLPARVEKVLQAKGLEQLHALVLEHVDRARSLDDDNQEQATVERVLAIIERDYAGQLSVESIARQVYLSANYLGRLFKSKQGMALSKYITTYRLEKAKALLEREDTRIGEVATACGYKDFSYFCLMFKEQFGVSPSQYRQMVGVKGHDD